LLVSFSALVGGASTPIFFDCDLIPLLLQVSFSWTGQPFVDTREP
jgi:hypothetical protein